MQYWTGSQWAGISGGSVVGNQLVWRQFKFSPIATAKIRILVTRSTNPLSRIAEVEAYSGASTTPSTDLIGFPLRVVVGGKGLAEGVVEVKRRTDAEPTKVPLAEAVSRVRERLSE